MDADVIFSVPQSVGWRRAAASLHASFSSCVSKRGARFFVALPSDRRNIRFLLLIVKKSHNFSVEVFSVFFFYFFPCIYFFYRPHYSDSQTWRAASSSEDREATTGWFQPLQGKSLQATYWDIAAFFFFSDAIVKRNELLEILGRSESVFGSILMLGLFFSYFVFSNRQKWWNSIVIHHRAALQKHCYRS